MRERRAHLFETIRLCPELVKGSIRLKLERLVNTGRRRDRGGTQEGRREEGKGKWGGEASRQKG